jgi:alpha-galactosidase
MTPEQAAGWAYPQADFTDDEIAFTLCGALLGRVHLSGHLDQMSRHQRDLVAEGIRVYKSMRADLPRAAPFWPLGLPHWADSWIALGLRAPEASYLTVWHRGPFDAASGHALSRESGDPAEVVLPIRYLSGQPVTARILYPASAGAGLSWDAESGAIRVSLPRTPSACVISLTTP